jgi:GNAT superfamily N-acetyltransferase
MDIVNTTQPSEQQKEAICTLWNNEYPAQLAFADMIGVNGYLDNLIEQDHFFAIDDYGSIIGWAFSFVRDGERWFAIIVDGKMQGKRLGTRLLNKLKEKEALLNGWVTDHNRYVRQDGTAYPPPLAFYLKNGFEVCNDVRLEVEKLSAVKIKWDKTTF